MPEGSASASPSPGPDISLIECRDPATGEVLGTADVMTHEQVSAAVARGRHAQRSWAKTSFATRRKVLRMLLARIVAERDDICRLAVRESGKTMVDAMMGEVFPVCEKLRYTIAHGAHDLAAQGRSPGFLLHKRARVEYLPLGVIGVIAPWNFPFHNLLCPTIPALFAGNAVVIKVSEYASWSSQHYLDLIRDVLRKCGHDPDLVQVVTGYGPTGAALVRSGVDKIFFTGSPWNGSKVMENAAHDLTPVVLELGGKDPMIVCDDADLGRALDSGMLGVFTACGQMCVGAERLYVFDSVYDAFVGRLVERVRALRQGPPLSALVDVGATTMPRQLEIIEELLADAVEKGARVLVGGQRNTAAGRQYFQPTVLVDVTHDMRITQEEVFGPVAVIMRVRDEQEAIERANDCPFGLGSSVFTRDRRRGARIARQVRAGMTVVNDYGLAYMMQSLPFGGLGRSGFGRINGREGLRACCNQKAIVDDRIPFTPSVAIHPIGSHTYDLVASGVSFIYGAGLGQKAKAATSAVRNLMAAARDHRRTRS